MAPTPRTVRGTALIILDMINTFAFPRGAGLRRAALSVAPALARLKQRIKAHGGLCVYANDNFSDWSSDFEALVVLARESGGHAILDHLSPEDDDRHVLKPRHSAFHQTPLQSLLHHARIDRILVSGVSTEACVLATALDARILELDVAVISDCVASSSPTRRRDALAVLRHCEIRTIPSSRAFGTAAR